MTVNVSMKYLNTTHRPNLTKAKNVAEIGNFLALKKAGLISKIEVKLHYEF